MTVRSGEGRTVWVRLIDVPLKTRLFYARVLRERDLRDVSASDALAALERALDYDRAARNPSRSTGIFVTPELAEKVLRG